MVARTVRPEQKDNQDNETLLRVFFRGFFLPLRLIAKPLRWIGHRPPFKQVGHVIRRFFHLRIVRFFGRILGISYIRASWKELKEVTWPSRHEGYRLTTAVIIFSVIFGALIAVVDYGLDKLFKQVLLK